MEDLVYENAIQEPKQLPPTVQRAEPVSTLELPASFTAIYDYTGNGDDELTLHQGQKVQVLSTDFQISGDEGWWTGKIGEKVGVFPANFVRPFNALASPSPVPGQDQENRDDPFGMNYIKSSELSLKEVIGIGGFGKVHRGKLQ